MYVIKGFVKDIPIYYVSESIDKTFGTKINFSTNFDEAMRFDSLEDPSDLIINSLNMTDIDNLKVYPVCPSCNKDYEGHPAISRKDNKTLICSGCGTLEALNQFLKIQES